MAFPQAQVDEVTRRIEEHVAAAHVTAKGNYERGNPGGESGRIFTVLGSVPTIQRVHFSAITWAGIDAWVADLANRGRSLSRQALLAELNLTVGAVLEAWAQSGSTRDLEMTKFLRGQLIKKGLLPDPGIAIVLVSLEQRISGLECVGCVFMMPRSAPAP